MANVLDDAEANAEHRDPFEQTQWARYLARRVLQHHCSGKDRGETDEYRKQGEIGYRAGNDDSGLM